MITRAPMVVLLASNLITACAVDTLATLLNAQGIRTTDESTLELWISSGGSSGGCREMSLAASSYVFQNGQVFLDLQYVMPGTFVQVSSADGILVEACGQPRPLPSRVELPHLSLVQDPAGLRVVRPPPYVIFGFIECTATAATVTAQGPASFAVPQAQWTDPTPQPSAQCCPNASETFCGGSCVDIRADPSNCGGCGWQCANGDSGASCNAQGCVCPASQFTCRATSGTRSSCCPNAAACQADGTCSSA